MNQLQQQSALIAPRPDVGTVGRPINVVCNLFEAEVQSNPIYRYEVDIRHGGIQRHLNEFQTREILRKLLTETHNGDVVPGALTKMVYDGQRVIWSANKGFRKDKLMWSDDCRTLNLTKLGKPGPIRTTIELTSENAGLQELDWNRVVNRDVFQRDTSGIQCLDVVLKEGLVNGTKNYVKAGRGGNQFFRMAGDRSDVACYVANEMIEVRRGFTGQFCVVGDAKNKAKLHLLLDVANQPFYTEMAGIDFVVAALWSGGFSEGGDGSEFLTRQLDQKQLECLAAAFKDVRVQTVEGNVREYKVVGLKAPANRQTFELKAEDDTISTCLVSKFYEQKFNYRLRYPNLPCLHMEYADSTIYIPIEVCQVVARQSYRKRLSDTDFATKMKSTSMKPPARLNAIANILRTERFNQDPFLREFGVHIADRPKQVAARVLPTPQHNFYKTTADVANGAWMIPKDRNNKPDNFFKVPHKSVGWSVIALFHPNAQSQTMFDLSVGVIRESPLFDPNRSSPPEDYFRPEDFFDNFTQRCMAFRGVSFAKRPAMSQEAKNPKHLNELLEQAKKAGSEIVFLVIPEHGSTEYEMAKWMADTRVGIATQAIKISSIARKGSDTGLLMNMCLQVNAKLLGVNSKLVVPKCVDDIIYKKNTMICGMDVIHPSPGDKNAPSIAAMVASVDNVGWKFSTRIRVQNGRQERVDLFEMMTDHLESYKKSMGKEPEHLIMLRDGVSDGQFQMVLSHELPEIKRACKQVLKKVPPVTIVVVKKRNQMRLFCANEKDTKSQNVPPGTCVDTGIVSPTGFDFYLVSQAGIGTVVPTHYHVVHNDAKLPADTIQQLLLALCHIDQRCMKANSIPIPTHYADVVCTKVQSYLKANKSVEMMERNGVLTRDERGFAVFTAQQLQQLTEGGMVTESLNGSNYFL